MTYLSLFSGGGGSEWWSRLVGGLTCVGYVESNKFCWKVLRQRIRDGMFDDAPIFTDIRTFNGRPYRGKVDLVVAGPPCQFVSTAGNRSGWADDRNMWPETFRVIREINPPICFFENVPNLLSHPSFEIILDSLENLGYVVPPPVIVSASQCGAPHLRKRLWLVAYPAGVRSKRESVSRSPRAAAQSTWWSTEPGLVRVAHGVADWGNRLEALGNGWVPAVARVAWEALTGMTEKP